MMNIIPSEKWLSTEYLRTNAVALLFWSDWHTRALGCLFPNRKERQTSIWQITSLPQNAFVSDGIRA